VLHIKKGEKDFMNMRKVVREVYLNSPFFYEFLEKNSIRKCIKKASDYATGRLLDIGCGIKPYENCFKDKISEHIGLEYPFPTMYKNILKIDVFGDATVLPFRNEVFDTILCTQVIEHVTEPKAVFLEMGRVLKKGGHIILTAPQEWQIHKEPYDFWRFTMYGLEYLTLSSGLRMVSIDPRGKFWALIGQKISTHIWSNYLRGASFYTRLFLLSPIVCPVQLVFGALDYFTKDSKSTFGYILVARK